MRKKYFTVQEISNAFTYVLRDLSQTSYRSYSLARNMSDKERIRLVERGDAYENTREIFMDGVSRLVQAVETQDKKELNNALQRLSKVSETWPIVDLTDLIDV